MKTYSYFAVTDQIVVRTGPVKEPEEPAPKAKVKAAPKSKAGAKKKKNKPRKPLVLMAKSR